MKTLITSMFVGSLLMGANVTAQNTTSATPSPEAVNKVKQQFNQLLGREIQLGDADALRVQKLARANNNKVVIGYQEMLKLVTKWQKTSYAVRFSKLYEANKLEGDVDALRFAEKAKANNGELRVNAAEMIKFVKKWEALAAKSEL